MNKNVKSILLSGLLSTLCFSAVDVFGHEVAMGYPTGASLSYVNPVKAFGYPVSTIKGQSDSLNCTVYGEQSSGAFDEEKIKLLISRKVGYPFLKSVCSIDGIYKRSGGKYVRVEDARFSCLNARVGIDSARDTIWLPMYETPDSDGQRLFWILNIVHTSASGSVNEKVAIPFAIAK